MKRHNHDIDIPDEIEYERKAIEKFIGRFDSGSSSVDNLKKIAIESKNLIYLLSTQFQSIEDREEIYRSLYLHLQATANFYLIAQTDKERVVISVDDLAVSIDKERYESYIGINSWLDGYIYALAGREKNVVKLLRSCPESEIRKGDFAADTFFYSYIEFLKNLEEPNAGVLLDQVFKDCTTAKIASKEFIEGTILPELHLWETILKNEKDSFNEKLENAVKQFNNYWNQKKSDLIKGIYRYNSMKSLVSIRLCGISAYAYDKGFPITYQSDYLVDFLIKGELTIDAKVTFPEDLKD